VLLKRPNISRFGDGRRKAILGSIGLLIAEGRIVKGFAPNAEPATAETQNLGNQRQSAFVTEQTMCPSIRRNPELLRLLRFETAMTPWEEV